ncbi:MAG: Verru_Chthon cassette protein B [Terrimicrobiaceae bacterium]
MKRFTIADLRLPISCARFPSAILGRMAVAPIPNRQSPIPSAFSLVEVTLALGIVSFCLLAVVGLLPAGLKSIKNANEQAGAANVVGAVADSVRTASSPDGTNFVASFAGTTYSYRIDGQTNLISVPWDSLGLDGSSINASSKRLAARLDIYRGSNLTTNSRAVISVAWPAQANPTWDSGNQTWSKAEGSVTAAIQFLPKP